MEIVMEPFDEIKFAALSNSKHINHLIKNVTIGPNRTIEDTEQSIDLANMSPKQKPHPKVVLHRSQNNNSSTNLLINHLRSELDRQRQDKVKEALNKRVDSFKQFYEKQEIDAKRRLLKHEQLLKNKVQQQELLIISTLEQHEKDTLAEHQRSIQYYNELAERKKRNNQELQEKEKQKQQIHSILDRIKSDQVAFGHVYEEICRLLINYKYLNQLKAALGDACKQLSALPESMKDIVTQCRNGAISENDCQKTAVLVKQIKELLELVKQKVIEVNKAEEVTSVAHETAASTPPLPVPKSSASTISAIQAPSVPVTIPSSDILKYVSQSSLKIYTELEAFMENFEAPLTELLSDDSLKQFRFDCKKAVNIPVNAISATSSHHLADKYNRLSNLLGGKTVEVGGMRVCAANHPLGVAFCKSVLASNFVLQGDLMISSQPEAAFSYSAVIVSLWNEHADFGKLLVANFYSMCPYLVPMYLPRTVGQTDEEFYRSQGYTYFEGAVEKQDKFLKRMAGTMRLYAAIIIAWPKQGQTKNPHGINEGWRWLAAFVNLEPKPDITATMLHVFLETAGSTLETVYGKSFRKLMLYICGVYLPIIQKIDTGGPVVRLEVLLQNYIKQGHFETPKGILPTNFLVVYK